MLNRVRFPSYTASIITGAIWIPIFQKISEILEENFKSQLILMFWGIIGFILPVIVSSLDLKYLRAKYKNGTLLSYFRSTIEKEDFRLLYIPAWKRLLVMFLSIIISFLIINISGVINYNK